MNNGGLKIPSKSVFQIIEYAELVFKRNVCKEGNSISSKKNLKKTMIMSVCHHFVDIHQVLFADHEEDINERVFEDEHRTKLVKHCADQYLTLRLFTYAKRFNNANVVQKGQPSDRHRLTKSILSRHRLTKLILYEISHAVKTCLCELLNFRSFPAFVVVLLEN